MVTLVQFFSEFSSIELPRPGQTNIMFSPLIAHVRKSVGALSRADRPDAARKTSIPSRPPLGADILLIC